MRVLIAGVDGYLGWPLAQYLTMRGHDVAGADLLLRRQWVEEVGGQSALPIPSMDDRLEAFHDHFGKALKFRKGDLLDFRFVRALMEDFKPEAVVHLGEVPSAPYSMMDQAHAAFTQQNNVIGNLNILWAIKEICPEAHLVKLGTMGEYGTPDLDIPEGFFEVEYRGRKDRLPFPRQASSFYHWSKVHDSNNTMFACNTWGLRSTDIMQGIVYGTQFDEMDADPRLQTRLDFDQCFGTVINRFCCQAVIEHPLTVFGKGGQKRGFLPLRDSMQCLSIAVENPPALGEYRVFNQFEECYSVNELAYLVQKVAHENGLVVDVHHYDNPREELESHYYNPDRNHLVKFGYVPTHDLEGEIRLMISDLLHHRERILQKKEVLIPDIRWDGTRHRSEIVDIRATATSHS